MKNKFIRNNLSVFFITLSLLPLTGCKPSNRLLDPEKIEQLHGFYSVAADDKTYPCQQYYAGLMASPFPTCDQRLNDDYHKLKHFQPVLMDNVSLENFKDTNLWKKYLGQ